MTNCTRPKCTEGLDGCVSDRLNMQVAFLSLCTHHSCIFFFSDDPFVRGAEFWQVHDLILKMILTGMLIYIPPTSRAAAGALVCMLGLCTLNYKLKFKKI